MKTGRRIWRGVWRIGLCGLLLGWVFHAIFLREGRLAWEGQGQAWPIEYRDQWQAAWSLGPRALWQTLSMLEPFEGSGSVVFMGLTIALGMLRWRLVLRAQGIELSLGRTAEISLVAHFFNSFLLGSTGGDLIKAYYAARETHHLKTEAVVTVFIDRLIGLFAMLLFATLMMIPNYQLLAGHARLAALGWCIILMLIGSGAVTALSLWGGLSRHWPQPRQWLRRLPYGEVLERSLDACRRLGRQPRLLLQTFGLSMALNLVCVLQIWCLTRGLDLAISPVVLLAVVPMIICISALPITPSGLGVRENLYVWILAVPAISVGAAQALAVSLLAYAGSLLWSLLGGVVYVMFKQRHHLEEIVARPDAEVPSQG